MPYPAGKYGFKTTNDGCAANTQKLADWVPNKNGTPDGASIAQAEVSLSLAGYGNCAFGLDALSPAPERLRSRRHDEDQVARRERRHHQERQAERGGHPHDSRDVGRLRHLRLARRGDWSTRTRCRRDGTRGVAAPSLPSNFDLTDLRDAWVGGFTPPPGFLPLLSRFR
ncbi:MAG: hypothetical protein U1E86_28890 [Burkholderiaceae bacterium]